VGGDERLNLMKGSWRVVVYLLVASVFIG